MNWSTNISSWRLNRASQFWASSARGYRWQMRCARWRLYPSGIPLRLPPGRRNWQFRYTVCGPSVTTFTFPLSMETSVTPGSGWSFTDCARDLIEPRQWTFWRAFRANTSPARRPNCLMPQAQRTICTTSRLNYRRPTAAGYCWPSGASSASIESQQSGSGLHKKLRWSANSNGRDHNTRCRANSDQFPENWHPAGNSRSSSSLRYDTHRRRPQYATAQAQRVILKLSSGARARLICEAPDGRFRSFDCLIGAATRRLISSQCGGMRRSRETLNK